MAVTLPDFKHSKVFTDKIAIADINSGSVIVLPDGRTIVVDDVQMTAIGGAVGGTTGVYLEDTNSSPVIVFEFLAAALTENAVVRAGAANTTIGAGWGVPLTAGKGLKVVKHGNDLTTATHVIVTVHYHYAA